MGLLDLFQGLAIFIRHRPCGFSGLSMIPSGSSVKTHRADMAGGGGRDSTSMFFRPPLCSPSRRGLGALSATHINRRTKLGTGERKIVKKRGKRGKNVKNVKKGEKEEGKGEEKREK